MRIEPDFILQFPNYASIGTNAVDCALLAQIAEVAEIYPVNKVTLFIEQSRIPD
jgi:hypothetical protein